jgi:predicted ATPase
MSEIYIRLLGPPRIEKDGKALPSLKSRTALALLTYLLMNPGEVPRSQLAGMLWTDEPESKAHANLRYALWILQRALGTNAIQADRLMVACLPSPSFKSDLDLFRETLMRFDNREDDSHETMRALQQVLDAYRGDLLEGFELSKEVLFNEWLQKQRAYLRELTAAAMERLARWYSAQHKTREAIAMMRRLLNLDPWREEAHRTLMGLLVRNGQRSAALAQYEICRHVLQKELGVEPMKETRDLYERIRSAESMRRHNLPPATLFVQRAREMQQIRALIENPVARLITLVGPGGIGKTRLALELAGEQTESFLHGVRFVSLASISTPEFLVPAIANAAEVSLDSQTDSRVQLLNYLSEKEMLIVLDNFEQVMPGAALVGEILNTAPFAKILITSRQRLKLAGEWVVEIGAMDFPASEETPDLGRYSAVKLYLQNARQAHGDFQLSESDKPYVVRICNLVGGMPLAIELASSWVHTLSCREIAEELEKNLGLLESAPRGSAYQHPSLRAAFEHSWNLLNESERQLFRKLAIFHGGFRREAAEQITGASLLTLTSLVEKSLVHKEASGRYKIHPVLCQFGMEKLRESESAQLDLSDRHSTFFTGFLAQNESRLKAKDEKHALEEISAEIDNIRAAWEWAVKRGRDQVLENVVAGLYMFYDRRGWYVEGEETFGRAAQFLKQRYVEDKSNEFAAVLYGRLAARQGWFAYRLGNYTFAEQVTREALNILQAHGTSADIAFVRKSLGEILGTIGEYDQALELPRESLDLYKRVDDPHGAANCLAVMGNFRRLMGDFHSTEESLTESLQIAQASGDRSAIALALNYLGIVAYDMGDYARARELYQRALKIRQEIGDTKGTGATLGNLGVVAATTRDFERATQLLESSLAIRRHVGDRQGMAWALSILGDVARGSKQIEKARELYTESHALFAEIGDRYATALGLTKLGQTAFLLSDYSSAEDYLLRSLETAWATNSTPIVLIGLAGIAQVLAKQKKDLTRAVHLLAFVSNHPSATREAKKNSGKLLRRLKTEMSARALNRAIAQGKKLRIEQLIDETVQTRSRAKVVA